MNKSRFIELFGDLNKNDKNWTRLTVGEAVNRKILAKPLDGNHGEKHPKATDYVADGIPFLMANNLNNGVVDLNDCAFISKKQAELLDKGFAKDGDVLLTHKGTIGRTAILHCDYSYIVLTPQITYYRCLNKNLNADFLKAYFDTDFFQNSLKRYISGSTRAYVSITTQAKLPLFIPDLTLQIQYADFVQQVDKSKYVE